MDTSILYETCRFLEDDLREMNAKIRAGGGKLNNETLSYIDKLTHAIKSIKSIEMAEQYDGVSERGYSGSMSYNNGRSYGGSYDGENSYARGRGGNAKRDSMGRYSRDGYSRESAKGEMLSELRELMQDAEPHVKDKFRTFISEIERM